MVVPVHYAPLVQGLIYQQMENPALRTYLHDHGFPLQKRRFKLFTFSRLMGAAARYDRDSASLILTPPLHVTICSPIPFILQELGTSFLRQGQVRIGNARLTVQEMATAIPKVTGRSLRVRMLSPLVVYSTFDSTDASGRRYTHYYSPFEPRFVELVGTNLAKKHLLVYGRPAVTDDFSIRPWSVVDQDLKVTRYKETIIKGWMGQYELTGDPDLLQMALDAGLGSKNSQGYGCCVPAGT